MSAQNVDLSAQNTELSAQMAALTDRLDRLGRKLSSVNAQLKQRPVIARDCSDLPARTPSGVHLLQPGPAWTDRCPPTATRRRTAATGPCSSGAPTSSPDGISSSAGRRTSGASASCTVLVGSGAPLAHDIPAGPAVRAQDRHGGF